MRYFLCLSYDGAEFCGWQIQPHSPSVQACLEAALSRLLSRPVQVTGAGRTDTGVHASGYVAHFDIDGFLPYEASDFTYKLNAILPRSIAVHSVSPVADDLHSRFSAKRREYTYFIHREKDPFVRQYSWLCGYPGLDFAAMNEACQYLLGTHDFSCFEKTGGDNKTSICTVHQAFWAPYTPSFRSVMGEPPVRRSFVATAPQDDKTFPAGAPDGPSDVTDALSGGGLCLYGRTSCLSERSEESPYWYFRIAADRFLRNMVRATVGSLIEVGRGKHRPQWIAELIASGTRSDAGESVPGHALFLSSVNY